MWPPAAPCTLAAVTAGTAFVGTSHCRYCHCRHCTLQALPLQDCMLGHGNPCNPDGLPHLSNIFYSVKCVTFYDEVGHSSCFGPLTWPPASALNARAKCKTLQVCDGVAGRPLATLCVPCRCSPRLICCWCTRSPHCVRTAHYLQGTRDRLQCNLSRCAQRASLCCSQRPRDIPHSLSCPRGG